MDGSFYGVPEYRIVFPETRTINAYALKKGKYELTDVKAEKGILTPVLFPELNMDLTPIFDF
jgi:Uma2 family endonuclease